MICSLDKLKVGQRAKVISIEIPNKSIKQHLLDMGLTRGVVIEIKKVAPMGDPLDIELRGYELCVGKKELQWIKVEIIE